MVLGYGWTRHFELSHIPSLAGKVAIVTGSNSGVGKATAQNLAAQGARVVLACRNASKASAAADEIRNAIDSHPSKGSVEVGQLDLSDLASVESFATQFASTHRQLDILVCNAAIVPPQFTLAARPRHEVAFTSSHLGHFYLVNRLLPLLQDTADSRPGADVRVVVVAADVTKWIDVTRLNGGEEWLLDLEKHVDDPAKFNGPRAYLRTKICNVLFARRLAALLRQQAQRNPQKSGLVRVNALHPGVVSSEIFFSGGHASSSSGSGGSSSEKGDDGSTHQVTPAAAPGFVEKLARGVLKAGEGWTHLNATDGALTSLYAATSPEVVARDYHGEYLFPFGVPADPAPICKDDATALRLWQLSVDLCREAQGERACEAFDRLELDHGPGAATASAAS